MLSLPTKTPLRKFAFIAGLGILFMATSPFAEFLVYQKLVIPGNASDTIKNILSNKGLFLSGVFSYLINFICDVVVAWALYFLLKPVNESLSLLTAWFQLVYAVMSLVALLNLVSVLRILNIGDYTPILASDQIPGQVMLSLSAFRDWWAFSFFFFAIHLVLLGYLAFKSGYIPKWVGISLVIAGIGYMVSTVQRYLLPKINLEFITITYFGELIFMFWLLIKGRRIKELSYLT